jgi:enoyl-CoA hydratase
MNYESIIYTKDESGIIKIVINRPEVRNALNIAVRQELKTAVSEIDQDKDVCAVIITGAGDKAFVSGADLSFLKDASPEQMTEYEATLGQQLYADIENIGVPVIAMINGFCLGGGLELVMCCDIRIASTNAKFGQPEINVGIIPGGGGTQRLPRLIGWGRAKELIYTGRIMDSEEAEKFGLVERVVSPDKLEEEVNRIVQSIAAKSSIIMRLAKKAVNNGMYTDLESGLAGERENFALCFATEDQKEGVSAFLEKRQAEFKGK